MPLQVLLQQSSVVVAAKETLHVVVVSTSDICSWILSKVVVVLFWREEAPSSCGGMDDVVKTLYNKIPPTPQSAMTYVVDLELELVLAVENNAPEIATSRMTKGHRMVRFVSALDASGGGWFVVVGTASSLPLPFECTVTASSWDEATTCSVTRRSSAASRTT